MLPKIGDVVALTCPYDVDDTSFKIGTKCKIDYIYELTNSIRCYPLWDTKKGYPITLESYQYELLKELTVGCIIKYMGRTRNGFNGTRTEEIKPETLGIVDSTEFDDNTIKFHTLESHNQISRMYLTCSPEDVIWQPITDNMRKHIENLSKERALKIEERDKLKNKSSLKNDVEAMKIQEEIKTEKISSPAHYNKGQEVISFIDSWSLNFAVGNVVKYVTRAPYKGNQKDDYLKALWYMTHEIKRVGYIQELTEFLKKELKDLEGSK